MRKDGLSCARSALTLQLSLARLGSRRSRLQPDKGFNGKAFAAAQAVRGTAVLIPPARNQRAATPTILLTIIARWRNRIEATFAEITDLMGLTRHGAHTFWGLLTRTAATIAAHTLMRVCFTAA
jgi:hypothetical protein